MVLMQSFWPLLQRHQSRGGQHACRVAHRSPDQLQRGDALLVDVGLQQLANFGAHVRRGVLAGAAGRGGHFEGQPALPGHHHVTDATLHPQGQVRVDPLGKLLGVAVHSPADYDHLHR